MYEFVLTYHGWIRAFHIISVISWMAGLLYLPRIFVYHADAAKGSELSEIFKVMEKKLFRFIMNPAMILTWIFGGLLIYAYPYLVIDSWMHVKLSAVAFMTLFHHALGRWRTAFLKDENHHKASFFRKVNEIPTVLMIIIVIMVIVRPVLF